MSNKNENTNPNTNDTNPNTNDTNPNTNDNDEKIVYNGFGARIVRWFNRPFNEAFSPVAFHKERAEYHNDMARAILHETKGKDRMTVGSFCRGGWTLLKRTALIGAAAFGVSTFVKNNKSNEDTLNIEDTNNDDVIE